MPVQQGFIDSRGAPLGGSSTGREATGPNPHYKVFFKVSNGGGATPNGTVEFWCPETLSFSFTSDWDTPFATTMSEMVSRVPGGAAGAAAVQLSTGYTTRFQKATVLVWQGATHVEFSFNFELRAENHTKTDVTNKLRTMIQYTMPGESGPCLSPSVADHPLRPATDRRLGRPLPHQLANLT